jgi:hypothetical protein
MPVNAQAACMFLPECTNTPKNRNRQLVTFVLNVHSRSKRDACSLTFHFTECGA